VLSTRFTELVGCSVPIQLAGMGGTASPPLAAAVAEAGGLGMISAALLSADDIARVMDGLRERTSKPVGINFVTPLIHDRDTVEAAASRSKVVEFFLGTPDRSLVELAHAGGALASWQVGSREDALAAAEAGCDLLVLQGVEAGGHVAGQISLFALLDEVLDLVRVPVIAAGGIGSGRTMAAALAAGASAVRVGTRFVAAEEADAHPGYVQKLIAARARDTVLTKAFHVLLPDMPHRVLRSSVEAATALQSEIAGELVIHGKKMPLPRWAAPNPTRLTTGHIEAMALYAGESVSAVKAVQPAADIVRELAEQAEHHLRQWATRLGNPGAR
jgi:NAD(P)H-dependent flavin oxidoreductase YrpB (nitropropane dioxygenase family)